MKRFAIVYIQGFSLKYEQEKFLINELERVNAEIFIVCDEDVDVVDVLNVDKEHLIKGRFINRIEAYRYAYRFFEVERREFDDLFMCDNSFFGPFIELSEILTIMKKRKLDCWMLSKYAKMFDSNYRILEGHADSSFLYFAGTIVKHKVFKEFWNKEISENQMLEEVKLIGCINEAGLKWGTYIDFTGLETQRTLNNIAWLERLPYTMLQEHGSPILKKDCFVENDFRYTGTNETLKAIDYVKEHMVFDEKIIWDYLLENYNIADIINIFHLHYVLPKTKTACPVYSRKKCAIIMHITYLKAMEKVFEYIKKIPEDIDLYITSKGIECIELIKSKIEQISRKNYKILLAGDRGRDISALLVTCKSILMRYEYICFVHDNKTRNDLGPAVIGESHMWSRWDNSIRDAEYISNILELLEKNEKLGVVIPPVPYFGGQFMQLEDTWVGNYEVTLALAERLGLAVNISKNKYNYSMGTTFWCKTKAMRKLFEAGFTYDDYRSEPMPHNGTMYHATEQIFLYVAQDAGYYSAIVENEEYAAGHINDLNYILNQILNQLDVPISGNFDSYLNNIDMSLVKNFVKDNKKIYIYGDGYVAHQISDWLKREHLRYESYVISDGREKKEEEEKVIYLSEISADKEQIGIIVALSGYYQREVVPNLREKGYSNLYIV